MKLAIVTGATSGVGQATVLSLAKAGYQVALFSRRESAQREIVQSAGELAKNLHPFPLDIINKPAVESAVKSLLDRFGRIDLLVNAAGTNIPQRSLSQLTEEKMREVFDTNLTGSLNTIMAVLPAMRKQQGGTIVNINSIAGQHASILSGASYVMSKFALAGLTQSINAEEAKNNIRATSIFPGDINTPLLERRPTPPTKEARVTMLQPQDVADCVMLAVNLPARAVVEELRITPR